MRIAVFITVVAVVVDCATPISADDRPSDPFGNHTTGLNNKSQLFAIWESLRDQVLLDKAHFHACIEASNESCPEVSTLMKIVDEARQNQGKALLGHLNRSINLLIKAAPGNDEEWLILDNSTNLLLRDSEKTDYEPTAILDYTGVRRYLSAFWMD